MLDTENARTRKKESGIIGSETRLSQTTNSTIRTTAASRNVRVYADSHECVSVLMSPHVSVARPAVISAVPGTSRLCVPGSLDSFTAHQVTPRATIPIGTLTQKTA